MFISGCASLILGVHFRACFTDSWFAAVLFIEGVHFRACFADSWCPFQGVLRIFVGCGGTIHRGCSFQGLLRKFVGFISGRALHIRGSRRYYPLRVFLFWHALQIRGVHFRACSTDSWVAAVLSIEAVHFRACFADSWCSFQGVLCIFVGRGGTIH